MKVGYHPAVPRDVTGILRHYDAISDRLGDEFWAEMMALIDAAAQPPERCHFDSSGWRRVNLRRFPYHFLFRMTAGGMRVLVVRQHKRHPSFGTRRR